MKIAKLLCVEDVIIFGRNENGEPDICFEEGNEYLFCVDEKKGSLFIYNDVQEIHHLQLNDEYTSRYFIILAVDEAESFNMDEFSLKRLERLYKNRRDFQN